MRFIQRTLLARIVVGFGLVCLGAGATRASAAEAMVETIDDERFVGRVIEESAEFIRFESGALGEVKIPRAKIRRISPPVVEPATPPPAVPVPPTAAVAPAPPAGPTATKGLWRTWLKLPAAVTASIAAGANLRGGAVDQSGYSFSLTFGYETPKNVFNSVFQYEYMKAGTVVAADGFFSDNLLQHNFSEKSFLIVGGRYREDQVMQIDHELNIFAAPGMYLVKTPRVELGIAGGPSWLVQDYSTVPAVRSRDLGLAAYQFFQFKALPRVMLTQNNLFTQSLEDREKYIYRFFLTATIALSERLSLVNVYAHGYDSQPAPGVEKTQDSFNSQLSYRF